ncbi:MAG: site-2 protease family protein [Lentisphaeria bacterium]|nr:site-2 protease family protein [Lentisphaeria bacterium]
METLILIASVVLMVIFFGLCIIVHEFGHFIVAKFCGLHIEAFSVGFKKIWGKTVNGVEYRIGCIPCGGYVDLPQIDSTSDEITDSQGNPLPHAEPWKRIATAFAGPFFNIIFSLFLGIFVWIFGIPQPDQDRYSEFTVHYIPETCPEYEAGLRAGDRIVKLNGHTFDMSWSEFMQTIMLNDDNVKQVTLDVMRAGEPLQIVYTPGINDTLMPGEKITAPFFQPEMNVFLYPLPGGAAKKAGIQPEDRVIAVDGEPVFGSDELISRISFSNGKELSLLVERAGNEVTVNVTPTPVPGIAARPQIGIVFSTANSRCEVEETVPGMPAAAVAALRPGDVITEFNGRKLADDPGKFAELVAENGEKEIALTVLRGGSGDPVTVKVTPRMVTPHEIGVSFYRIEHPTPFQQFANVLKMTERTLQSLGHTLQSKIGRETGYTTIGIQHLSGPLSIGRYMILSFQGSFMRGLYLVVVISFSLGLFNLLPIPVLDGGHILIALIEIVIRRPVPVKIVKPVTYFFMFALIGFMVIVSFFDVKKMIPQRWMDSFEVKIHRASGELRGEGGSEGVSEESLAPFKQQTQTAEAADETASE